MNQEEHPNDLVTLTTAETEFQAGILTTVLEEAGIDARAFGTMNAATSMGPSLMPVVVQVRKADLERARAALKQNISDSMDIDWDEVDVGERQDEIPLTEGKGMPAAARIGFIFAMIALVIMLAGIVLVIASWLS